MEPDKSDLILEELARLREEVVSTRNAGIKTDNVLKGLAAEFKSGTQKQVQGEHKLLINSIFSYILFALLAFGGLYLVFEARLDKQRTDQTLFEKKEASYKREIAELKAEVGRWKQIERELLEFERLVREGNKEQAVAKFSSLRRVRFSGLLEDLIVRFRGDVAEETYERGVEYFKVGNFEKADEAFLKSLEYSESPSYLADLLYYQGMSAVRIKDYPRAAEILRKALSYKQQPKVHAEIQYHLAYAYDRMGEKRTARELYQAFVNQHPKHPLQPRAVRRINALKGNTGTAAQ